MCGSVAEKMKGVLLAVVPDQTMPLLLNCGRYDVYEQWDLWRWIAEIDFFFFFARLKVEEKRGSKPDLFMSVEPRTQQCLTFCMLSRHLSNMNPFFVSSTLFRIIRLSPQAVSTILHRCRKGVVVG